MHPHRRALPALALLAAVTLVPAPASTQEVRPPVDDQSVPAFSSLPACRPRLPRPLGLDARVARAGQARADRPVEGTLVCRQAECLAVATAPGVEPTCNYFLRLEPEGPGAMARGLELVHEVHSRNAYACQPGFTPRRAWALGRLLIEEHRLLVDELCDPALPRAQPPLGQVAWDLGPPGEWLKAPGFGCPSGTRLRGRVGVEVWCERRDGKRHGPALSWSANPCGPAPRDPIPPVAEQGPYVAGRRHGVWRTYDCAGPVLREEGAYRRGRKVGSWRRYDEKGAEIPATRSP
ncbi:MAG TPA: hypothetical protein PK668_12480 [Myxococcota bacterium]|nr:hypothetical protein [Myxococcota bacterium]HRY93714.1 hypothetical protein [Myxococcota bacterium]HSA20632.1 hypothetical protein [Myxococcota bacterium]